MIKKEVEAIITNLYRPQVNNVFTLKLVVGLLLSELMHFPEKMEAYTINTQERLLSVAILNYICSSYKEGSLAELSNQLKIPNYKICRVIKKHTGKTFKQLVQEARLSDACELLRTTNMSITTIMEEVGYQNITFFYKIFKNQFHMTPKEYRSAVCKKG